MTTLGRHPDALAVKLTVGDGAHLVATSENGWAGPVLLHYGPKFGDPAISDSGTVDGNEVSWTLTEEQVEARAEHGWVRLEDNGVTLAAGRVLVWSGGLGSTATQTIASLTAGPPGPTAVSADAGNLLKLGTDNLLMLDPDDLPAGGSGGDTTVQIGTVTLPESPTVGLSVSVLADSDTVLPEGVTWDSGGEPTITERMLLVFVWSGTDWVGTYGPSIPDAPVPPDETGPTAGTLGVVVGVTSADGTVTGAEDETELDAAPYDFGLDGVFNDSWQAGNTYEWTGLTAETAYDFQHRVRDAAGNITEGAVVTDTTEPVPPDTVDPTPGTLAASAITSESFTLTVTGASDDQALDPAPYAFSTDNGSSFSAWQSAATFDATGLTPETEYTCVHKVRDLAGNEATGSSIAVETSAAGGGSSLSSTFIDTYSSGADGGPYTFSAVPIGAADADRIVVVSVHWSTTGNAILSGITIGGVTATVAEGASAGSSRSGIAYANVPTGTTADVVVTITVGTPLRCGIGVWTITGEPATVADSALIQDRSADPVAVDIDMPSAGVVIGSAFLRGTVFTHTWASPLGEDFDLQSMGGEGVSWSGAHADNQTGTVSVSVTGTSPPVAGSLAAIGFVPA